jgi:two-component system sensor histidine kinase KdpD
MLEDARRKVAEGVEVVAGVVETHGRAETQAMIADLPVAPRVEFEHRGATLTELDLDALLAWRPQLVLIDELAHTNAPGSRHPKRYHDVLECWTRASTSSRPSTSNMSKAEVMTSGRSPASPCAKRSGLHPRCR